MYGERLVTNATSTVFEWTGEHLGIMNEIIKLCFCFTFITLLSIFFASTNV